MSLLCLGLVILIGKFAAVLGLSGFCVLVVAWREVAGLVTVVDLGVCGGGTVDMVGVLDSNTWLMVFS